MIATIIDFDIESASDTTHQFAVKVGQTNTSLVDKDMSRSKVKLIASHINDSSNTITVQCDSSVVGLLSVKFTKEQWPIPGKFLYNIYEFPLNTDEVKLIKGTITVL